MEAHKRPCIAHSGLTRGSSPLPCLFAGVQKLHIHIVFAGVTQTPGRIQKVDTPWGSVIYTVGDLNPEFVLDPLRGRGTETAMRR